MLRLVVFLDLQKTPQGYKISKQEDHVLWAESFLLNVPYLGQLWRVQGRRAVGVTICYTTRVCSPSRQCPCRRMPCIFEPSAG